MAAALPHGDFEFGLLIERFFTLDPETRAAVIQRLNFREPRIVRENPLPAQQSPAKRRVKGET